MPTLFRWKNYRFFFYSKENGEPPHIHVERGRAEGEAKFWIHDAKLAKRKNMADHEIGIIKKIIIEKADDFLEAWNDHFRD